MMNALVTVTIGEAYHKIASLSHQTFIHYANRHNLAFRVIEDGQTYFAKLKLYELLDKYDRLIFVDTDTIIRNDCPNLLEVVPDTKFGAFDEHKLANNEERAIHYNFMNKANEFYKLPIDIFVLKFWFFNTGVMVLSKCHKPLFEPAEKYLNIDYYDQLLINLRLGHYDYETQDITHEFNRMQYIEGRVTGTRLDCYIIHYAGIQNCFGLMKDDLDRWG